MRWSFPATFYEFFFLQGLYILAQEFSCLCYQKAVDGYSKGKTLVLTRVGGGISLGELLMGNDFAVIPWIECTMLLVNFGVATFILLELTHD